MTEAAELAPQDASSVRKELGLRWTVELGLIVAFYLTYTWVRNQFGSGQAGSVEAARRNAQTIIDWQESMWLLIEDDIQSWFIDWTAFIQFWNLFYGFFHFAVTAGVLAFLYFHRPRRYAFWRTAGLATTAVALVGYATFPLMPPRLLGNCGRFGACEASVFVDTVADVGGLWSFDSGGMAEWSNQFAAMPSMHIGWAIWCSLVLTRTLHRRWARVLAVLYPWATMFAVVVTANHWILDAVGGALAVGVGLILAKVIHSAVSRSRSRPIVSADDLGSGRVA